MYDQEEQRTVKYHSPRFKPDLPLSQHPPNTTPVPQPHMCLNFIPGQPLKILQPEQVPLQIRLSRHDPPFQKERLFSRPCKLGVDVMRFKNVVADGRVPDDPRVHVDAGSLH
jgi:hypothetical protein